MVASARFVDAVANREHGRYEEKRSERNGSVLQTMEQSSGNALGYKLNGDITKADTGTFGPVVESLVKQYGSVNLVLDIADLHWEKASALSSDIDLGQELQRGRGLDLHRHRVHPRPPGEFIALEVPRERLGNGERSKRQSCNGQC